MAIVQTLIQELDNSIKTVGDTLFVAMADIITPLAAACLSAYVAWLGFRIMIGGAVLSMDNVGQLLIRITIIFSVGLYWQNFEYFYDILSQATGEIAFSFFTTSADGLGNTPAQGMDQFANDNKAAVNNAVSAQGSITRGVLGSILIFLMGCLQAVYVFVVAYSKISIGVCISTAPMAFLCLMSERTKNLFETWLQSVIAYSIIPIAAAATVGVLGTMLGTIGQNSPSNTSTIESIMIFLVLMLLGKATLVSVPILASNLTGHISLSSFTPDTLKGATGGLAGNSYGKAVNQARQFANGAKHNGQTVEQTRMTNSSSKRSAEAGRRVRDKLSGRASRKPPEN